MEKRSSPPSDARSDTDTMNKEKIAEEGRMGTEHDHC